MEPRLASIDEDLCVEITKPKDVTSDLIISVSISRTYTFTDLPDTFCENGDQKNTEKLLREMNALLL